MTVADFSTACGDLTAETRDGVAVTAAYDAYGRLTSYTRTGTPVFAMVYSGSDERVQVSVDGTPRRFVHDESGRVIGEYGATGTVFAEHVWLMPDTDEGGWEPLALLGQSTLSYVHGDHLGVPVQITDANGATVNAMKADPFGQRFYTASTSAPRTSLAFPGQIIDIADRHYNLYRDYDPTLGRYLQADPIGLEGGDNVYGYVGGNPLNRIDPTGEIPLALGIPLVWAGTEAVLSIYDAYSAFKALSDPCASRTDKIMAVSGAAIGIFGPGGGYGTAGKAAKGLIPKAGTRVKPKGVPEGWRIRPSISPGGVKYSDPVNPGNHIRVEQGNPGSPFPNSRGPYVRDVRNGQYRDANGNIVAKTDPAGHIPLQNYKGYRP
jgi:RHS repeat-associated protein